MANSIISLYNLESNYTFGIKDVCSKIRRGGGELPHFFLYEKFEKQKISKNFSKIYCNTPVVSVHPHPTDQGKVCVVDHTGKEFIYDHVIVATQANHARTYLFAYEFF